MGQLNDYLVGQLVMGVNRPFPVLSSYEETCIAHLNDNDLSRHIFDHKAGSINERLQTSSFDPDSKNDSTSSGRQRVAPCCLTMKQWARMEMKLTRMRKMMTIKTTPERWCTHADFWIIGSLILALRCGLDAVENSPPRDLPAHGAMDYVVPRIQETSMSCDAQQIVFSADAIYRSSSSRDKINHSSSKSSRMLERFQNPWTLKYRNVDLRWRHVGV